MIHQKMMKKVRFAGVRIHFDVSSTDQPSFSYFYVICKSVALRIKPRSDDFEDLYKVRSKPAHDKYDTTCSKDRSDSFERDAVLII